jgi:hypothetical protein
MDLPTLDEFESGSGFFFLASEFLSEQVRMVPSKYTPTKVNPSFTLQPERRTLVWINVFLLAPKLLLY